MKKKLTKYVSLGLATGLALTGCANSFDYSQLQYAPVLTKQEVIDYYAEQMSYDTIIKRTGVKESKIQFNPVPEDLQDKLVADTQAILTTHQLLNGYENDMPVHVHEWLKLTLDDLVLELPNGQFTYTAQESQGYYYVTVPFSTKLNSRGEFKGQANYVGINGFIIQDEHGTPKIDEQFLKTAFEKLQTYLAEHRMPYYTWYEADLNYGQEETTTTVEETLPETDAEGNEVIGGEDEATSSSEEGDVSESPVDETVEETETEPETRNELELPDESSTEYIYTDLSADGDGPYQGVWANNVRQLEYDVNLVNSVVGTSKEQMAAVPYLSMVYNPVDPNGVISGYGLYNEGSNGLKDFGYDRANYPGGTIAITFVFKQNPNVREEFDYKYCYINSYETGITMEDKNITLSSYIEQELDTVIERADRAINNLDSSALMGQTIFEASDLGLKYTLWRDSTNVLFFATKRVKTLDRLSNKTYLVELERTSEESSKGFGNTARYTDKYYAVIRQDGTDFKINDIVWVSRVCNRIPDPDVDNSITRRLTSLNLAGDVYEQQRRQIEDMLARLYYSGTNQTPEDKTDSNGNILVSSDTGAPIALWGVYSRFDSDTALLPTARKEYLQAQITGRLMRYGATAGPVWYGQVTEWLGGYTDQVEFTTREFVDYTGAKQPTGTYIECYYLVNHYGTDWVIDDIVVINEEEVDGENYNIRKEQVANNSLVYDINSVLNNVQQAQPETQAETQAEAGAEGQ